MTIALRTNSITSSANKTVKYLKKLQSKKERDVAGQFVVENLVIIHDALAAGFKPVSLFITPALRQVPDDTLTLVLKKAGDVIVINEKVNKAFSALATPPGIAALYDIPGHNLNYGQNILYLNGISDPGNLGAILRTAAAFNFPNVVLDERCADAYNPKTIQAAKDAVFKLNIVSDAGGQILDDIKKRLPVYAADMRGVPLRQSEIFRLKSGLCLVFGSEAHGVDRSILTQADGIIAIPMRGAAESLNVAVAAGIILYELSFDHA